MAVGAVAAAMTLAGAMLPRVESHGDGERVRYGDVLRLPGAWTGYLSTFAYMIGFYQTYTFIGDHVRQLHGAGAWLGGTISLSLRSGLRLRRRVRQVDRPQGACATCCRWAWCWWASTM